MLYFGLTLKENFEIRSILQKSSTQNIVKWSKYWSLFKSSGLGNIYRFAEVLWEFQRAVFQMLCMTKYAVLDY